MLFSAIFSLLAVALANASPIAPQTLVVVTPSITSPTAEDQWPAGSNQTVTWGELLIAWKFHCRLIDACFSTPVTTNIPPEACNYTATILLGHITEYRDENGKKRINENLDTEHPLAAGFPLTKGFQQVTVPHTNGSDFIVVLLGDSGNKSPKFKIVQ
ncbi:hypothetical protein C8R46DRAFT_1235555 [Mycena filopes]|nr:hypothetical protein C8R46DRAFT_1235555 [Mycena filopes]